MSVACFASGTDHVWFVWNGNLEITKYWILVFYVKERSLVYFTVHQWNVCLFMYEVEEVGKFILWGNKK